MYSFIPCTDHRVSEGDRDYELQQISGISWYGRKDISSYGLITRNKKKVIPGIVDFKLLLPFFNFFEKIKHAKLKRPQGLPRIDLLCNWNQVPSLPGASVFLPTSFYGAENTFLSVITETRARAISSWVYWISCWYFNNGIWRFI